ncbi:MAG TPA: HlyC/CorC family transporter [Candidatus Fimimorpha faecalis]|uniref:HlyC/CorC family transporter n=1 Tax=Candidatus Fimimorpha faecalis TaxID=2840824 RepID=A0A9D1JCE3_9FIRM|nr:HlyC/CorC family transporter [Candidatus Fimimorpha faecalis]
MDSGDVIQLIMLLILIGFSAIFSSAETALMTCNRIRLRSMENEGNKKAGKVLDMVENSTDKMLSAILIGNNVVNLSASSLATVLATKLLGSSGAGIATGVITLLVLIFGEITPKSFATISADKLALMYYNFIHGLMIVLTPVIFLVGILSRGVLFLLRVDPDAKPETITESELRAMVDVSHEEGVLESDERKMITNVFDFGDSQAKDIMIPRVDVTFIQVDATYNELLEIFREDMFTRFPVYEESTDDVIGVINMKDVLLYDHQTPFSIRNYLREVHFTYEHSSTLELLQEMRETSSNVTIVLDEYGATVGMITLEDLLEEIVGEIRDEYDENEIEAFQKTGENQYNIEASMKLDDINEILELNIHSDDYDSLGGFIIELLDRLPKEGEEVSYRNMTFKVLQVEKNRIDRIQLTIHPEFDIPEDGTSEAEN